MITCCVHKRRTNLTKVDDGYRMRATWLEKADPGSDSANYEWLHLIADKAREHIQDAFIDAIHEHLQKHVNIRAMQEALAKRDLPAVLELLGITEAEASLQPGLMAGLQEVVHAAGTGAVANTLTPAVVQRAATTRRPGQVLRVTPARNGELAMRFDMVNPHTVQQVRQYGFNLIRQISDDTRDGIRQIVADAMEYGGHPYDQARKIRDLIGLTQNQAAAVSNFRRLLETRDRAALTRELRDRRFDPTLDAALGDSPTAAISPEQVDTMVQRYADRMLAQRAETIARTETINAARIGTQNAWIQAAENGLLNRGSLRQQWVVTPDDRLCIYCSEVPDMNPEGVPLGQPFETLLGPVDGPTLHPNCRCTVMLLTL